MPKKRKNPREILMDLTRELDGGTLEDTFEMYDHEWTIRLLNEEETNWRNGFLNMGSRLAALSSFRLPTLAIGIRAIDGYEIMDFFEEEWRMMQDVETGNELLSLLAEKGPYAQKYFAAEHLMEWLGNRFPDVVERMWGPWQALEDRREEAQESVKKSSGENSVEATKPSGTESSPSGDESRGDSESKQESSPSDRSPSEIRASEG